MRDAELLRELMFHHEAVIVEVERLMQMLILEQAVNKTSKVKGCSMPNYMFGYLDVRENPHVSFIIQDYKCHFFNCSRLDSPHSHNNCCHIGLLELRVV